MTPRREVVNCTHGLSPHAVGVATILRSSNYFQYAHAPRSISRWRVKQQLGRYRACSVDFVPV
jgi:hypothetical protein